MSFKQRFQQDLREAVRLQDQARVNVIRMLLAAFEQAQEAMGKQAFDLSQSGVTDLRPDREQVLGEQAIRDIIRNEVKQRQEAVEVLRTGRQIERAEMEEAEIALLEGYLTTR